MALKVLDPAPAWAGPDAGRKVLDASPLWATPDSGRLALDARPGWSAPEIGIPAGDLPVGTPGNDTLVKLLTFLGEPVVWRVIGKNLPGMPEGSITLLADRIIALRCFDAQEPNNNGSPQYANLGNGYWSVSNLRQWMNSDAPAGQWYSPQHSYDAPPDTKERSGGGNAYQGEAGMLHESQDNERQLLMPTTRKVNPAQSCIDRLFLLTTTELFNQYGDGDGTYIPYFNSLEARQARCTAQCIADSDCESKPSDTDQTLPYWLATMRNSGSPGMVDVVRHDGYRGSDSAGAYNPSYHTYSGREGVRPACNIPATAILAQPDPDGCYTIAV